MQIERFKATIMAQFKDSQSDAYYLLRSASPKKSTHSRHENIENYLTSYELKASEFGLAIKFQLIKPSRMAKRGRDSDSSVSVFQVGFAEDIGRVTRDLSKYESLSSLVYREETVVVLSTKVIFALQDFNLISDNYIIKKSIKGDPYVILEYDFVQGQFLDEQRIDIQVAEWDKRRKASTAFPPVHLDFCISDKWIEKLDAAFRAHKLEDKSRENILDCFLVPRNFGGSVMSKIVKRLQAVEKKD